ncbi:Na/Pi cotransporter family protein [Xanthobacter agilis]|uniref:Na/Pi cotransporter family protein n=1 Tax=Xanthobacter agilis TaxID=47492 RepID=UPI0037273A85
MTFSVTLIDLVGYAALLLWGTHMVRSAVERALGPRLKAVLARALRNRWQGFAAGLAITALLQSSTATAFMVSGFAAAGLVGLVPALAAMLGANVGTTLIVQVLSFDVAAAAPALILAGFIMFRSARGSVAHDLGRAVIGLGLILLALHQLVDLMRPLEDAPSLRLLLGAVATVPVLDVILAAALTWAVHSSVAVVLIVMSLASQGVVPPNAAFALILGANLGSALAPALEATGGSEPAARRLPVGNLINRVLGVALALAFIEPIGRFMVTLQGDPGRAAADFHTLFNLVTAALFLPALGPFSKLLRRLYPDRADAADPTRPLYLSPGAHDTPIVAVGAAAREALRLADTVDHMLAGARDALLHGDRRRMAETQQMDDILDRLNSEIKTYLTALDPADLTTADRARVDEILTFATNMEQAGDVVNRNLLLHASKRLNRGLSFSPEGRTELQALLDRLGDNVRLAASLFMTADPRAARLLAGEKAAFRASESLATRTHFDHLRSGLVHLAEASTLHLDLIRDLKLINAHIVAAAAYPVLERSGELLVSRLSEDAAAPQA